MIYEVKVEGYELVEAESEEEALIKSSKGEWIEQSICAVEVVKDDAE